MQELVRVPVRVLVLKPTRAETEGLWLRNESEVPEKSALLVVSFRRIMCKAARV